MSTSSEAVTQFRDTFNGMTLDTRDDSYIVGEAIYRRADRYVVKTQRTDASGHVHTPQLVIKISLPTTTRAPDEKVVSETWAAAIDAGSDMCWVAENLQIISGSTQAQVAEKVLHDASSTSKPCAQDILCDKKRTLRILILSELFPINTLSCASDFAQVFFDVLNCHKRLHDVSRVLHRDISISNITYRYGDDGAVYGVLNDMDVADLEDQKATSIMHTGTPPFIAVDLLRVRNSKNVHLYRHDLESLFYVMMILFTRHQISSDGFHPQALPQNTLVKRAAPPFSDWFDSSVTWEKLAVTKRDFMITGFQSDSPTMNIDNLFPRQSSFTDFRIWIFRLHLSMSLGFTARVSYDRQLTAAKEMGVDLNLAPFNEETLDGKIQYSTFFDVMKSFAGKDLRAPPQDLTL